jgi:hypothetical protein
MANSLEKQRKVETTLSLLQERVERGSGNAREGCRTKKAWRNETLLRLNEDLDTFLQQVKD